MNQLNFAPTIDIPLIAITVAAFIWHFNHWALRQDIETTADLPARLPAARFRVILLFVGVLLMCWSIDLAVWSIFALVLGIGLLVALCAGGDFEGGAFGFFALAYLLREWAFGFPELILHPQRREALNSVQHDEKPNLLGKTGITTTSLRPTGEALIDDMNISVVSWDGRWIDAGMGIEVKSYRNNMPCVAPFSHSVRDGKPSHGTEPQAERFDNE